MLFRRNDVNGKPSTGQRGCGLHSDEAASDDSDTGAADHIGEDASAVVQGTQHHHMREVPPWNVQSSWSSPRRKQELRIRSLIAIPQAQKLVFGFDVLNALAFEVDAKIGQGMLGDRQSIVPERALEIVLSEKRPVVRLLAFFREDRDPSFPTKLAYCVRRR
jgi:hypothetical protein